MVTNSFVIDFVSSCCTLAPLSLSLLLSVVLANAVHLQGTQVQLLLSAGLNMVFLDFLQMLTISGVR